MISQLIKSMYAVLDYPHFNKDCLSTGQLKSKEWLIDEVNTLGIDLGVVFICAGWYATLATMLFESNIKLEKIRSFDIDPLCESVAETFNKPWVKNNWKFKSCTANILELSYPTTYYVKKTADNYIKLIDMPTTIINTSCEHIDNFQNWFNTIPNGTIVILQTNNYIDITEHVNCSTSLDEFSLSTPLTTVLFSGELELTNYTRYMRIGIK